MAKAPRALQPSHQIPASGTTRITTLESDKSQERYPLHAMLARNKSPAQTRVETESAFSTRDRLDPTRVLVS